jgi:hypothetical protein
MDRTRYLLPILVLSLPLLGQAPAKGDKIPSPATPNTLSANQGISPDDLILVRATPYHPTLVRDPFATPSDAEQNKKGDLVDDIAIKGRVVSRGKVMAVVSDSRGMIRMISPGYRFRDGELISVDEKSATFHQWDASGANTKAYRTVVKTFKREEGKR